MRVAVVLSSSGFLFLAFLASAALGQPLELTPQGAREQLAGTQSRAWILKDVVSILGSTGQCSQGEVYRFASNRDLTVESCIDGKLQTKQRQWAIEEKDGNLVLRIDEKPYRIAFRKRGSAYEMLVRDLSDVKAAATTDMTFRMSQD
jgi:hypothetical protein